MSGQQIGTVVGGAIGAYFGGPAGAQLGMAIGGAIGGAVDPTHINGPKIGDGQQQAATDGNPIAWVQGSAMVAGTIVQVSSRRQIRHKDNGKGGPVQVTFTAVQDFAILICESCELRDSTMDAVLMVMQDGKLVYDVRPGSTMLADSYKWKANVDFLFGAEDQLPHPTLEAITGVGNTPAYRGSLVAVFKNFDVSAAGDRIPNFQFVVASDATGSDIPVVTYDLYGGGGSTGSAVSKTPLTLTNHFSPPGHVRFGVPAWEADDGTVSPRRFVLRMGGAQVWDSGWIGDVTYQSLLDSKVAASAYPEMTGALSAGYRVSAPIQLYAGMETIYADFYALTVSPAGIVFSLTESSVPPPNTYTPNEISLQGIVQSVCKRGGLAPTDIDVTGIAGVTVAGYPIARQANAADCLLPLMQAYFGYGTEYDAKLRFKFYGENASITVDPSDLLENTSSGEGNVKSDLRNQETEFPRRIVASYMDPAQNYTVVQQAAERRSIDVRAIGDQAFQIPVVMNAATAAKAADRALKVAYATLQGKLEFSTPFAGSAGYITVAAGEAVIFNGRRYVADEMILGNGSIKFSPRYDRQGAYTSNVQPILGNAPVPPSSPYSGPTTLIPMNLPAQRPQDSVGVYIAAAGTLGQTSWAGCTVQVSYDGLATWQNALTIAMESEIGTVALAEPTGGEPLTVSMVKYDLVSATSAQLAAQANAFAVTDATGNVTQLGQFGSATETMTDHQFELTSVSRSLGGTAAVPVAAGNPFTLMDAAYFLPIDPSFAGRRLYFRAVGYGENAEDAPIVSLVYTALARADSAPFITEDGLYQFTTESGTLALSTE